jgi:hypothetical protein
MRTWLDDILELHDQLRRANFTAPPDVLKSLIKITGAILEIQDQLVQRAEDEEDMLTVAYQYGYQRGKDAPLTPEEDKRMEEYLEGAREYANKLINDEWHGIPIENEYMDPGDVSEHLKEDPLAHFKTDGREVFRISWRDEDGS